MSDIRVSELSVYPVKSCRGINQTVSQVEAFGLQHDRRWMVVDQDGIMLTQRKLARLCLIQPELNETGLRLKYKDMDDLYITIPVKKETCLVKVWNDNCQAQDAGDAAAEWLSQILETKCRLVYFPDSEFRQVDLNYANSGDKTAFSDGFPLLLISEESLNDLNQRLDSPILMNRFRPNIVVKGGEAFAEDKWKKIRVNGIIYRIVKPCSRCVIPSINIDTAEREAEPTKTLVNYRKQGKKIYFGQNVIAEQSGRIDTGMQVDILEYPDN